MALSLLSGTLFAITTGVYTNVVTPTPEQTFRFLTLYSGGHAIAMIIALAGWVYLNLKFLDYDINVSRFSDNAHCLAFARHARLEAYARHIRKDPAQADLIDVKEILKQLGVKP